MQTPPVDVRLVTLVNSQPGALKGDMETSHHTSAHASR